MAGDRSDLRVLLSDVESLHKLVVSAHNAKPTSTTHATRCVVSGQVTTNEDASPNGRKPIVDRDNRAVGRQHTGGCAAMRGAAPNEE